MLLRSFVVRLTLAIGASLLILAAALWLALAPDRREDALVYALAGGGVAALGAAIWAWRLAQRVREVSEAAVRLAGGDLASRAPAQSASELGALAHGVNAIGERIGRRLVESRAQAAQLEGIFQSIDAGVVALDREQRVLRMNAAAETMLSVAATQARGKLLQEAVREPELNRFIDEAMADPTIQGDDFTLHAEGRITVRTNCGQLRDPEGRSVGLLVVLTDITEMRRLETMRTDFASNVSHELRTPITNIKGYVETLLEAGFTDEAQARKFLEIIDRNAARLGAIVEDLLLLTRLEREDTEETLSTAPIPAGAIVEAVVAQLDGEAKAKGMRLETRILSGLEVRANAQLAELALTNLVGNAIRYSPARSRVVIAARRVEGGEDQPQPMIELSVTDEGPGIAPEHLDRIFERFFRVDKARSREQGGTGLGLAIAKHIALVHGGRADATSEVGRGSTFRMLLPSA